MTIAIAEECESVSHHPTDADDPLSLSPECFSRFADFITRELGIKMPATKVTMLKSRLMRRLRELKIGSLDEYRQYLFESTHGEEERVHFINAVTTNKTDFFREPRHFDYLVQTALPSFLERNRENRRPVFTVWCAGCSSGEEPYTIAMVLADFVQRHREMDFQILATDISTKMLDQAKDGIYCSSRIDPIPEHMRKAYLLRSKDATQELVRVCSSLRQKVSFHRLNFMDVEYPVRDMFDVIFFRNVMIYFNRPTQEKVINRLCRNLKTDGYLFVGHSESLAGLKTPVAPIASAIFRK